jgi:hypothetical protein
MTQQEFFEGVIRALDRIGIPYMVTGSVGAKTATYLVRASLPSEVAAFPKPET